LGGTGLTPVTVKAELAPAGAAVLVAAGDPPEEEDAEEEDAAAQPDNAAQPANAAQPDSAAVTQRQTAEMTGFLAGLRGGRLIS
jgi:hypothetical protein